MSVSQGSLEVLWWAARGRVRITLAYRIHIYCRQTAVAITPDQIMRALGQADLMIEAEARGIADEEALVDAALPYLRIENTGHLPFEEWRLHYGPPGERDIPIERVAGAREVRTRIDTMIYEHLDDGRVSEAHLILPRLYETIEEVCITLGGAQTGDLGIVLAYELARYIAGVTEGLISDDYKEWWRVDDGVFVEIARIVSVGR